MTSTPQFEPMFPAHSIERCSIIITFDQALPAKAFQKAMDDAMRSLRNAGLEMVSEQMTGFQFDVATGRVGPATGPRPVILTSPDRATNFFLTQNAVTVQTGKYIRWQPLIGQFEELILPMIGSYTNVVSIANVQLDYLDRFFWTGDWSNFEWRSLLQQDSGYIARRAVAANLQWHSHAGWIENIDNELKRLINVNIDVADAVRPGLPPRPSIGIFTLMQDRVDSTNAPVGEIRPNSLLDRLESLHTELKSVLANIISPDMAARIGMA
jgi:uncharacterized protein (TIGR04255 family)